nr:hypothetical protein [Tanacetum cinerariifolium]
MKSLVFISQHPFGRPYRTHPNEPHHYSSLYFTFDSSSSSSSSDSSSDISSGSSSDSLSDSSLVHSSCQSYSGPSTRDSSPRMVDPPVRTPRYSSSQRPLDSFLPSAGPSCKRCISLSTLVPLSTHISRSISPALAVLPPRKRFKDSYSFEVSGEERMEIGTANAETVIDLGISEGVGAHTEDGIDLGVEVAISDIREDEEEFKVEASAGGMMKIAVDPLASGGSSESSGGDAPDLEDTLYDIAYYMSERDHVDSLRRHMALSQKEFRQVHRDRDDTQRILRRLESLVERRLGFRRQTMTNTHSRMTPDVIEEMINRRMTEAIKTHEANKNIGLGNGNNKCGNRNDNGNENRGGNGNGNHNENDRDDRPVIR